MPVRFVCSSGHEWEGVATDHICPRCGTLATTLAPQNTPPAPPRGDELPPLPRHRAGAIVALPGYEILEEVGRGGMGVVYKARQKSLNRHVALKMILSGSHAHPTELARFRAEAEAVAALQHPNIVQIHDIGEHEGRLYCALEFLEGGTLAKKLETGPLPMAEIAPLVATLSRAVHAAHERNIVHRDLKPGNVLFGREGTPKITDFGLAKRLDLPRELTPSGAVLGTPTYMAPEQACGRINAIGPATDVYALGAILYELLTTQPPFDGKSAFETMQKVVSEPPTPPSKLRAGIPDNIERLCLQCLEKEPSKRPASALALAEELLKQACKEPTPTPKRRSPWLAGSILTLMCGVLGVGWQQGWFTKSPTPPSQPRAITWTFHTIRDNGEVFDRLAFPTREVGYAASRQSLYRTNDAGKTWQMVNHPAPGRTHFLLFHDPENGWLGNERIYITKDGGTTWKAEATKGGEAIKSFTALPRSGLMAGGMTAEGEMVLFHRGTDRGYSWARYSKSSDYHGGEGQPFRQWHVTNMDIVGSNCVAIVRSPKEPSGAVLWSRDVGKTWQVVLQTSMDLHHVNLLQGMLVDGEGRFWRTRNYGQSWIRDDVWPSDERVPPSCLVFNTRGVGVAPLWRGKVLHTRDGRLWALLEIDKEGFGYSMPSAVVFEDGEMAILSSTGQVAISSGAGGP